ncbi:hypothetical protein GGI23_001158 [Coemansia sp. RSA 2559]|nr:hypothetical protein GGI23_001158 [Coemansia sp. RSA 2559]KAJ2859101.1 hypothetical protein GGI22_003096 [Coemansia erecta]
MHFNTAVVLAALSVHVSSSTVSVNSVDAGAQAALSSVLESLSSQYNNPSGASDLLSSALGYISSELPSGQKTIKQAELKSIISKYAPEAAPSIVDYIFSSAKHDFATASLGSSYLSDVYSSLQYMSKNGASSLSELIVSALNKEAPSYRLDGAVGSATGSTEDDNSASATHTGESNSSWFSTGSITTSGVSATKVASVVVPAAVGAIAMLF